MTGMPGESVNRDESMAKIAAWKGTLAEARSNEIAALSTPGEAYYDQWNRVIAESNVMIAEMLLTLGREITQTLTQLNQDVTVFSGRELDGD